ncbi:MAG: ergothioneine biosynthesis protein EgtB [Candidatus Heimdallarchaeota archaeon]|nr:ergothioneine biosynthesis protein EgtB [Candidatus Heimdallarchaeota archaeon]
MIENELIINNPQKKEEMISFYERIRRKSEDLASPLEIEDYMLQAFTDASPTKWHIGHTSWFFETFILKKYDSTYKILDPLYNFLYNSYYEDVGIPFPRPSRSAISRPTVEKTYEFRSYIDEYMVRLIDTTNTNTYNSIKDLILLGGNHEQQHQELFLTDIKYNLSVNPAFPVYRKGDRPPTNKVDEVKSLEFVKFDGGVIEIGHNKDEFAFDNEMPLHKEYLNPFKLANRLVTNGEYLEFMKSGCYENHRYWLSDGWRRVQEESWNSPLYWHKIEDQWYTFTLDGLVELDLNAPVTHVSFFEAEAFAKWRGKRLPTEVEWEHAVNTLNISPIKGNFMDSGYYHPQSVSDENNESIAQLFGDVWEWTASSYLPYPGFSVLAEGISEYNGKFMSSQMVLKGGSCATPMDHIRASYRNFFQPEKRWQFSGIRLAE